jgi:outer membrane protein OmpA-like peptidoglycan-associated protein
VATVDNSGRVTAVRAGNATITCTTIVNGLSRSATSAVTVPFPTWTISVSPTTATRDTGQTVQLAVTARDEDQVDVSAGATWSSSNSNVATVSSTGLVRCVSGGSATITVTKTQYNETKSATASITCNQPAPPPPADRMLISLDTIFFEFDRSDIRPAGRDVLNRVIRLLSDSASWRVSIEGHTDNYGTEEYNQRLSERRAQSVLNYLTRRPGNIDASRVMWRGYSERCLIVPEGDKQQQAINRRVEIWQLVVLSAPPEQCRPRRQ